LAGQILVQIGSGRVEGCRLVEVLTPEMQAEYVGNLPPWTRRAFAA